MDLEELSSEDGKESISPKEMNSILIRSGYQCIIDSAICLSPFSAVIF
jgi:hypothetical protein